MGAEQFAEVRAAAEAALERHRLYSHVAVPQELHGALHAIFQQVVHRGCVEVALEAP